MASRAMWWLAAFVIGTAIWAAILYIGALALLEFFA